MPNGHDSGQESQESGEVLEDGPEKESVSIAEKSAVPDLLKEVSLEAVHASRWDDHSDDETTKDAAERPTKSSRWLMDDDVEDSARPAADEAKGEPGKVPDSHAGASTVAPAEDPVNIVTQSASQSAEPDVPKSSRKRNMLLECRGKDNFDFLKEIGSGTYGQVSKARDKQAGDEVVALKKIKLNDLQFRSEGFPMTSVREINILLTMDHPNIVNVSEVVTSIKKDSSKAGAKAGVKAHDVYMVMEFVQQDLKSFLSKYQARLKIGEVERIVQQLLQGLHYMHENWVIHRDLKPANILYDHFGNVKICDFGMARHFGDPVPHMTPLVVTRNYRGPEICMGVTNYTPALDVWSVGVIAAELLTQKVPFVDAKTDMDLVNTIAKIIGSPHGRWHGLEKLKRYREINILKDLPNKLRQQLGVQKEGALPVALDHVLTETGYDLIEKMLRWDPSERVTAAEALEHEWFAEVPRPTEACFMPQTNEALRHKYSMA